MVLTHEIPLDFCGRASYQVEANYVDVKETRPARPKLPKGTIGDPRPPSTHAVFWSRARCCSAVAIACLIRGANLLFFVELYANCSISFVPKLQLYGQQYSQLISSNLRESKYTVMVGPLSVVFPTGVMKSRWARWVSHGERWSCARGVCSLDVNTYHRRVYRTSVLL